MIDCFTNCAKKWWVVGDGCSFGHGLVFIFFICVAYLWLIDCWNQHRCGVWFFSREGNGPMCICTVHTYLLLLLCGICGRVREKFHEVSREKATQRNRLSQSSTDHIEGKNVYPTEERDRRQPLHFCNDSTNIHKEHFVPVLYRLHT